MTAIIKGWDWTKVPRELRDHLKTEDQKIFFDMLISGMPLRQISEVKKIAQQNAWSMATRIKDQISGHLSSDGEQQAVPAPYIQAEVIREKISVVQEHKLVTQNKDLKRQLADVTAKLSEAEAVLSMLEGANLSPVVPIVSSSNPGKKPKVAATAFLSDTHFDEVVSSREIAGYNEYNRGIAEKRLTKFVEKTILVSREYMSGFDVIHLDLPFGGDMVSGNIHEELMRTNEAEIMDTVIHWSHKLAEAVTTLASEFPTVRIPCVVGNHGRNTKKPRHKGRVRDSFDWLIYQHVRTILKLSNVQNVEMQISETADALWTTLGINYLLTHGDQASGGSGWGGIFSPIMRLYDKKLKSYQAQGLSFDYMIMGHWHQLFDAGPVLVNGSLKGWDEFAAIHNFRPEPAQQAFWLTDPVHGKLFSGPLFVEDKKK